MIGEILFQTSFAEAFLRIYIVIGDKLYLYQCHDNICYIILFIYKVEVFFFYLIFLQRQVNCSLITRALSIFMSRCRSLDCIKSEMGPWWKQPTKNCRASYDAIFQVENKKKKDQLYYYWTQTSLVTRNLKFPNFFKLLLFYRIVFFKLQTTRLVIRFFEKLEFILPEKEKPVMLHSRPVQSNVPGISNFVHKNCSSATVCD